MAALCEGYTLCGLVPAVNRRSSEIKGIEEERDSDHVIVTDSSRSVTLYKVSDQKPLGSWTVKQGQVLTCAAVFNRLTNEYVAVSDNKVIRIWKEDDIILDKAFKATVSVTFSSSLFSRYIYIYIYDISQSFSNCIHCQMQTAPVEEVEKEVQELLSRQDPKDPQPSLGQLALALVSRSLADPKFYSSRALTQLVPIRCLSHSVCPDLLPLALEKRDYFLCQLCLLFFHDIPEAVTCACLKTFISLSDADAEKLSLEPDSVSFVEMLISNERAQTGLQNGFSPALCEEDRTDAVDDPKAKAKEKQKASPQQTCPVGKHKAALINEVLQTAYSEALLLPHLKDFSSDQVVLFLRYLEFLYLRYSTDGFSQMHGYRSPSLNQVMDWVCMLLDAHFTVLVMSPVAKGLLLNLQSFVRSQVRLFSELGKIEGSLQELTKMKMKKDVGQYSIEVIELY
uniref:Nucleolar protein 11 n=1 Tax=Xiphophorus couchianus TaxID=32473 RepID=A0A3B5M8K9_9TELE